MPNSAYLLMSKCVLIEHFEHKKFVYVDKFLCRNFSSGRSFLHPKISNQTKKIFWSWNTTRAL